MAQTIRLKRSSVQNNVPSTSDLELGELAINTYDGKLFIKKNDGSASIVQVGGVVGTSELSDGSVTTTKIANDAVNADKLADNSVGIAALNVSDGTNGQVLTTNGSGTLSFSTVSGGGSQNLFQTVRVSGQSDLVADSTTDVLTFAAGSGISLATTPGTDTLTITSTATGSVTEAFKNIAVSGQSNVVADGATDTLTLAAGSNMTITTNASNDTITFASSGGSGNTGGIDSQVFNGDGTDTTFTLTTAPATEDNLWVFVDGVYQNKDSYSVSGTTLTMGTAPDNGTKLAVHHVRVGTPANGTITAAMLASPLSLSGDFAVDTNVLKVDATNNRVGINVTTPSHPLDVVGNTNITGEAYVSSQIGIGTTSPGEPLHIVASDPKIKLEDSDGTSQITTFYMANGTTNIQSRNNTANGNIQFQGYNGSAVTQYARFNSTGKFVIGTGAPSYSLHVNSTDAMLVPVGTTAQRPTAAEGLFRYNSDDDKFEGYTAAGWGAIAGSGGGSSSTFLKQELTGNGSTTAFTLNASVTSEDNLIVFNEGVFQRQDSYAATGTTITFGTAPANGNKLVVYQMETGVVGVAPVVDTMTGDGSDTTLTLSTTPASENQTFLTVDGVMQHKNTYSISGTTLTFSAAPPNGSNVECITLVNSSVKVLSDTDGDTQIQLEESTDEDKIRFDTGGLERVVIDSNGLTVGSGNNISFLGLDGNIELSKASGGAYIDFKNTAGEDYDARLYESSGALVTSGNLTVTGDLTVSGSTTTLNTATLDVEDKNITLNKGSGDTSGSANGAGITIQDAVNSTTDATMLWDTTNDQFDFSHEITAPSLTTSAQIFNTTNSTFNSTNTNINSTNITVGNNTSDDVRIGQDTLNITGGNVGIGTTSAFTTGGTAELSISGSSVLLSMGASNTDLTYFRRTSSGNYQIQTYDGGNTGELELQPYGGNVGIGTVSTSQKLDVRGGNIMVGGFNGGTEYGLILTPSNSSTYWNIANISGGNLTFNHSNTIGSSEKMRIDASGRLLAGKNSVGARAAHTFARTGSFAGEFIQQQTSAGASVLGLTYDGAAPNNGTDYFIYAQDTGGVKFKVTADGNVHHQGLTMSDGTDVDQIKTFAQTLTITTSFADTGINGTDLQSGVYMFSLDVNDYAVGGGHYSEKYSGTMSWYQSNTNSTLADEIALHRAGHAPNAGVLYLRTVRTASADTDDLKLQIKGNYSASGSSTYTFKFRRMI